MPEQLSNHENHELKALAVEQELLLEAHTTPEHTDTKPEKSVEDARRKLEQISHSQETHNPAHAELSSRAAEKSHHPVIANKQLKDITYARSLLRTQKKLSLPAQYVSKAIHSPILDKPSELTAKTVARPSSMLGGALAAMIGTALLLWVIQSHGYAYNYLAIAVLFVGGAILGLLIELAIKALRRL